MQGHLTHTAITSFSYSTIFLKMVPTNQGFSVLHCLPTIVLFSLIHILPSGNLLYVPQFFHNSFFMTPFCNLFSWLHFTTHFLQLVFATCFCDSIIVTKLSLLHFCDQFWQLLFMTFFLQLPHHVTPCFSVTTIHVTQPMNFR